MTNRLVIVESPTKAKTIEKYLGKDYHVRASLGHVRDLPKSKLGVDVEQDFKPQYLVPREKSKHLKELKNAAQKADEIYLATDPDREGEAIAWHLAETIDPGGRPVRRVEFHEITKSAVLDAMRHPRHIDEIARLASLPMSIVSAGLAMMEIKGLARTTGGMNYVRGIDS